MHSRWRPTANLPLASPDDHLSARFFLVPGSGEFGGLTRGPASEGGRYTSFAGKDFEYGMNRRAALKNIAGLVGFGLAGCHGRVFSSDEPIQPAERNAMAGVAQAYMRGFDVPGMSVAIAHDGRLLYEEAFGVTGHDSVEPLITSSLFRIASVSKPITAAAIFTLVEQGRLHRSDTIFGKGAILGTEFGTPPYGAGIEQISVDHLLTHSCGGWDNGMNDPMFANPQMSRAELISWTVDHRPLEHAPGTVFAYSNFGYCVLGRVIEKVSGETYAEYVQRAILWPSDITDMRIAGNGKVDRAPGEVSYYSQEETDPYAMNVARMDSHGGWIATAADLVRFATHVDGFEAARNILKPETIRQMTMPSAVKVNYARGWNVNARGNWWHVGSLPGTMAMLVRTSSRFCWVALTNTRRRNGEDALDDMMWQMARQVAAWRRALA
jgi:CubicO group peptidase (beta-lactamase class C family)